MLKNLLNTNKRFLIATAIYILSLIIIAPWGDFAISDDFYYLSQVKAFSLGIFRKSALMGPTLILQSFMGLIWTLVFGHSYISVRILTILISIICVFIISKILKILEIKENVILAVLLTIYFNQQFYPLSLTFMTENYFLLFILGSLYFYLLSFKSKKAKDLLIASILGGLSIMIRQYGVILFITYITVYLNSNWKKIEKEKLFAIVVPFLILGISGIFWPRFKADSFPKSMDFSLFFTSFDSFFYRLKNKEILPYIGFIILPFLMNVYISLKSKIKILLAILVFST